MAKRRLTKEELRRDPVRDFLQKIFFWLVAKKDQVLLVSAIVIAVLLIIGYSKSSHSRGNPEAELQYLRAVTMFASRDTSRAYLDQFRDLVNKYGNTVYGKKALYYLGVYYLDSFQMDSAKYYLEKFIKSGVDDKFLKAAAHGGLGAVYESKGLFEDAYREYMEAYRLALTETYRGLYFFKAARAKELAGDYDTALKMFEEFKDKFKDHSFAFEASQEIAFIKGLMEARKG